MAATGYTPILIYASGTAAAVPLAADLTTSATTGAELAINYTDGKLYYKDAPSGSIQVLATKGTGTIGGSNTQVQFNNSGSLGGSSGLTWDGSFLTTSSIKNSALTSGRVTYAGTAGLLQDSANLTFNGTTLTANTIGAYTLSGTIAGGGNQINNVIIGTSTPLAGSFTTINASTSITNAGLTSGRVTFAGASGLLSDSANLTFDGTILTSTGLSGPLNGTVGATTASSGAFTTGTFSGAVTLGAVSSFGTSLLHTIGGHSFVQGDANATYLYGGAGIGIQLRNSANSATLATFADSLTTYTSPVTFNAAITLGAVSSFGTSLTHTIGGHLFVQGDATTTYLYGGTGGISFRNAANTSELAIITNAGNVGIGTSSPDTTTLLTVAGAVTITGANSGHGASRLKLGQDTSAISQIRFYGVDASTAGILQFTGSSSDGTVGGERMRINSDGDVLIGTTSSTTWNGGTTKRILAVANANSGDANSIISLKSNASSIDHGCIIEGYAIAVTSGSPALGSIGFVRESTSNTALSSITTFFTNTGGTVSEKMRLTSNGNLQITPSGVNNSLLVGRNESNNNYGAISFNNNNLDGSRIGFTGGGSGDNTLYIDTPTSGIFVFRRGSTSAMTLNASGNLLLGTTTQRNAAKFTFEFNGSTNNGLAIMETATASGVEFVTFLNPAGTNIANITRVGVSDAVTFNTTTSNTTGAQLNASGVRFPATQVASADANTLDDYEEGTWTPTQGTFDTWTSPVFSATYTKIGRLVTVFLSQSSGTTGWSAGDYMGGLPFTVGTSLQAIGYAGDTTPSSDNGYILADSNSTLLYFNKANASEASLCFTISYQV